MLLTILLLFWAAAEFVGETPLNYIAKMNLKKKKETTYKLEEWIFPQIQLYGHCLDTRELEEK